MNEEEFKTKLLIASIKAVSFAQKFVVDPMPAYFRYIVFVFECPNVEYVEGKFDKWTVPLNAEQIATCFLRTGRLPRRIEIGAHSIESGLTVLRLISGNNDFVKTEDELFNPNDGPFKIIGPIAGWKYPGVNESNRLHPSPEGRAAHVHPFIDYFD